MMKIHQRNQPGMGPLRDSGSALVITLSVVMVGAVILVTLAAAAVVNSKQTSRTRTDARALQSADAGIDLVSSMLEGKKYSELGDICATPISNLSINGDTVEIDLEFTVLNGGVSSTKACPTSTDLTQKLVVTSTATTPPTLATDGAVVRSVQAEFLPTPPTVELEKAIFSESDLTLESGTYLIPSGAVDSSGNALKDAHVYSNGTVVCESKVSAGGSIYATRGNIEVGTNCDIANSIWASGKVDMSASNSYVDGDVYAASSASDAFKMSKTTGEVTGSVLTNGKVEVVGVVGKSLLANDDIKVTGSVGGSAYSAKNLDVATGATVSRDGVAAGGNITGKGKILGNASASGTISSQTNVSGTKTQGSASIPSTPNPAQVFPSYVGYVGGGKTIQAPPREQMPILTMTAADILLWQAAGYSPEYYTGICTASGVEAAITGGTWVTSGRLMIFKGCSSAAIYNVKTLNLNGDLALVSDSGWTVSSTGTLSFNGSNPDAADYDKLFFITPADKQAGKIDWVPTTSGQTTPACAASPYGDIVIDPQLHLSQLNIMAYTPCTFSWKAAVASSSDPWMGQVYAGNVSISNSFDLQMKQVSVPSLIDLTATLSSPAGMTMAARFDVHQ